ncbi:MAG: HEAT repeat domain-containing protein, partial [Candidatus Heimdallarchaeota archaeon]
MPREEEVIPEEEIIGELIKALANEKAQDDIIYALAQIGTPALPYIRKLLQEKSVDSRITGVKILGGMGKPALQDLMAATNDKNSTVRYKAVRYIGHLEDQAFEALNILTKLSKDKDQWVQEKAQWAVKRINKSYVDRQITEILSVAFTKYKANDITFTEFTKIIGNYGKRSKYILDKIVDMKDAEQTKLYLKVYDYLVKEKMFSINDDVFNV